MSRIDARFAALKAEGRAGLITFITAGDPDHDTCARLIAGLPAAGADLIELGVPFTDPMADGPSIEAANLRALAKGASLRRTLDLVRGFRKADDATPVVLMGYFNPISAYGVEAFLKDAKIAGVDGLIVVDTPPEEDDELCIPAIRAGLHFIRLATPTTDDARLPAVLQNTSGFLYYVSIAGITGAAAPDTNAVGRAVADQDADKTAGGCRFRHPRRQTRCRDCRRRRCRRGRVGAGGSCTRGAETGDRSRRSCACAGTRAECRHPWRCQGRGLSPAKGVSQ